MINKPSYFSNRPTNNLGLVHRERYLPTAFDESLSYVEKLNIMIKYLNEVDQLTNEMLEKWNEVYRWVMSDGLDESLQNLLKEYIDNGTFNDIINNTLLSEINASVKEFINKFNELRNDYEMFYIDLGKTYITWEVI